ncbi:hypothetical protein [Marinivivus vitaminiproducens]|uniref:hypothetical protein n=1 Tax=Marinivivus vitaminiproducens TaxID=3035935 RepID=UPI0027A9D61A|nr:hypothetical protein P4R82_17225 [Geminicoccaceae bacterium SCSIO 64248]
MKRMRAMVAERARGGTIALLTAYMLVLQAFTASYVCGATLGGAAPEAVQVHCLPSGDASPDGAKAGLVDCPCAVFCGMGSPLPGLPPEHVLAVLPSHAETVAPARPADGVALSTERPSVRPRAPPPASA